MNNKYSILVNSTDSYEDCWMPFFKLFRKYWHNCSAPIYLNTELKKYDISGLTINSTQIGFKKTNEWYSWSESLLLALEQINTPLVLFTLDDLFLDKPVDVVKIDNIADKMIENNYSVVYLTDQSTSGPFLNKGELLWELDQKASYRISALIALWNVEKLRKYIRKHENPWKFEIYGTKRAHLIKDNFFAVNPNIYNRNGKCIISHCYPTGITRGKWNKEAVIDLFKENDIEIDFSKRGFYTQVKKTLKEKIMTNLNCKKQLNMLKSLIDLQYLKIKKILNYEQ